MNFTNIVNLATRANKPQDEFVMDNLSSEIQAALSEAMADEKKLTAKAAAMEIMALVKETRDKENALVEEIRSLRRKETEIKAKLAKINEAKQYAQISSNYIPLALSIGHTIPAHYRLTNPELMTVQLVVKEYESMVAGPEPVFGVKATAA